MKERFDWTMQTMGLLRQLLDILSETTQAWERFCSSNGDIGYFSDLKSSLNDRFAYEKIGAIKEAFENLTHLRYKLINLEKSCQNQAQSVSCRDPFTLVLR